MKREISFEKLSKENEIDEQRTNRDDRSKARRKSESKKTRHSRKSKKQTKHQRKSKRKRHQKNWKKKPTSNDSEIENLTKLKAEFRFLFLTKRRKNTDIETLKRLTIIVTVLTRSYFSTNDIVEIIDELSKRKRRILTQVSEIFTKLSKCWKILFLVRDFHSHDRKNSDNNDLNFFFRRLNENFRKRRKKSRKNFVLNENFKTIIKTFSFFFYL